MLKRSLVTLVVCLAGRALALAAETPPGDTKHWVGGDTAGKSKLWNEDRNWTSDAAPAAPAKPAPGDDVVFEGVGDCVIPGDVTVKSITLKASFRGTVTQQGRVTAEKIFILGGTWDAGTYSFSGRLEVAAPGHLIKQDSTAEAAPKGTYLSKYWSMNTGVATFSPYRIKTTDNAGVKTFNLDTDTTRPVAFFIDGVYKQRAAWSHDPLHAIGAPWDVEVELGFSNTNSDLAAKTIAGSGEFFGQFVLGAPFCADVPLEKIKDAVFTVDAEAVIGITTDISTLTIHAYYGIGPSFTWEVPFFKSDDGRHDRPVELLLGFYVGGVGIPDFEDKDSTAIKGARNLPRYREVFAEFARVGLHVPLAPGTMVSFDGLFFEDHSRAKKNVDPWSLTIALTLPLAKLQGLLHLE